MALPSVRQAPRLSASQLADYLVAPTPIGQLGILRQAKNPVQSKPLIIQYQHARRCISGCLQSPANVNRVAASAIDALAQRRDDPSSSPLVRDDAIRSIEVIDTFQRSLNAMDVGDAIFEPGPNPSEPLNISGVEISVWPDAIARTTRGGQARVGGVFIRCAIGPAGEAAENRRAEANVHLATIAHMHAAASLTAFGQAHAPSSMVVDVPRKVVVRAPSNITRRVANIEAACSIIAAVWPTI